MAWGTVTIGGVAFRETIAADEDAATLRIGGQESHPPSTRAHVEAAHHNLRGLAKLTVPVLFSDKAGLSGFYEVLDASSVLTRDQGGAVQTADWSAVLRLVGRDRDVEIESLLPLIPRLDELPGTQTPAFWHAPAIGATSYLTGPTVPSGSVPRASSEGLVTVHTGLPDDYAPRWTIAAADYLRGSARILFDSIRRVGRSTPPLVVWEVHNGLVHVTSGPDGAFTVSCWDDDAWRSAHTFALWSSAGGYLTAQPELTILRNDPEEVSVRLTYPGTAGAPGRSQLDLSLRRGSRFVTGILKRHSAAELSVERVGVVPISAVTGGLRQTSADVDGNRLVMGSARPATTGTGSNTHLWRQTPGTYLDFFVGHEVNAVPTPGDAFADLLSQYLAAGGEQSQVVGRR